MVRRIMAFGEDFAHREVIGALIQRIAAEIDIDVNVEWRNARRGHGQVVRELREYFRDLCAQGEPTDLIIVATDANCKGLNTRTRELPIRDSPDPIPVVLAIPDPHIERWLLLDGAAFKKVFGKGCKAPDKKCERARYKQNLIQAISRAGTTPPLGGIEFADDIIANMDLRRASRTDPSFDKFINDLRSTLQLMVS